MELYSYRLLAVVPNSESKNASINFDIADGIVQFIQTEKQFSETLSLLVSSIFFSFHCQDHSVYNRRKYMKNILYGKYALFKL